MTAARGRDRDDEALVAALRHGDARVFGELVEGWSGVMLALALSHVDSGAVARRWFRTRG
jgi:hypothetical protein